MEITAGFCIAPSIFVFPPLLVWLCASKYTTPMHLDSRRQCLCGRTPPGTQSQLPSMNLRALRDLAFCSCQPVKRWSKELGQARHAIDSLPRSSPVPGQVLIFRWRSQYHMAPPNTTPLRCNVYSLCNVHATSLPVESSILVAQKGIPRSASKC